jgi:hypothetical protein
MKELYVYYRVGRADASTAQAQIEAALDGLKHRHAGLDVRLLRRTPSDEDPQTWMEVYTHSEGVTPDLQAAIESAVHAMPDARIGARHLEVFEPLTDRGTR